MVWTSGGTGVRLLPQDDSIIMIERLGFVDDREPGTAPL